MSVVTPAEPSRRMWLVMLRRALPGLVLVLAFIYSLYLQTLVKDGVFFSGDAGPKVLMAEQFASGRLRFDLDLPADEWARALWARGWYPLAPPFVYSISGRHYSQYSFTFPLLSAPFFAFGGQRGLYALPLLSTWALWVVFLKVCRRLQLPDVATALALATLCFSTPLTLYSAMYWEHVPAVFLAFAGLSCVLRRPETPVSSRAELVWGGALLGASVALREELFCLVAALMLAVVLSRAMRIPSTLDRSGAWQFFAATWMVIGGYFALNAVIYGHPLGTHAFSVLGESFSLYGRRHNAWLLLGKLTPNLFDTFPVAYFLGSYGVLLFVRRRWRQITQGELLVVITCIYALTVPFVLPDVRLSGDGGKQWGPRFLLVLMPIVSLAAILCLQQLYRINRLATKYVFVAFYLVLFVWGVHRNTIEGSESLAADYSGRVFPVREFLRSSSERNVAVEYQHMAQELMPSLPQKNFFLVEAGDALDRFSADLASSGRGRFYYLRYASETAPKPRLIRAGRTALQLRAREVGRYGIYALFEVDILPTQG